MSSITATPDNTYGAVLIVVNANAVTGTPSWPAQGTVTLTRINSDGTTQVVRNSPVVLSDGQAMWWDDEAPLSTPVTYSAALTDGVQVAVDTWSRTIATGWGSPDFGAAWTTSGGTASDFFVSGGTGKESQTSVNTFRLATLAVGTPNQDIWADVNIPVNNAATANITAWLCLRFTDANNYYVARLDLDTSG